MAKDMGTVGGVVKFFNALESQRHMDALLEANFLITGSQLTYAAYLLNKVAQLVGGERLGHEISAVIFALIRLEQGDGEMVWFSWEVNRTAANQGCWVVAS